MIKIEIVETNWYSDNHVEHVNDTIEKIEVNKGLIIKADTTVFPEKYVTAIQYDEATEISQRDKHLRFIYEVLENININTSAL